MLKLGLISRNALEMLCTRYEIDVIVINMLFPENSEILIPARENMR
ncbi:hypothetical protein [Rickettsia oklahomensis]|uniref:Uncharacterized protein n=1 Tax=Rickettsia oklahomensis TaxID=3141789 RepID=A0AAU7BYQ2_9RICK